MFAGHSHQYLQSASLNWFEEPRGRGGWIDLGGRNTVVSQGQQ